MHADFGCPKFMDKLKQRLIFSNLFQHIDGDCPSPKISEYLCANRHLTKLYANVCYRVAIGFLKV